jgi:hypothetical protein
MNCNIGKVGYCLVALIWNIAVLSVVCFLASWLLDIVGSATDNKMIRGYAYGVAMLATISMFWFGLLAAVLSAFVKCKRCGSRVMSLRFPFFVSLIECRCVNCKKAA